MPNVPSSLGLARPQVDLNPPLTQHISRSHSRFLGGRTHQPPGSAPTPLPSTSESWGSQGSLLSLSFPSLCLVPVGERSSDSTGPVGSSFKILSQIYFSLPSPLPINSLSPSLRESPPHWSLLHRHQLILHGADPARPSGLPQSCLPLLPTALLPSSHPPEAGARVAFLCSLHSCVESQLGKAFCCHPWDALPAPSGPFHGLVPRATSDHGLLAAYRSTPGQGPVLAALCSQERRGPWPPPARWAVGEEGQAAVALLPAARDETLHGLMERADFQLDGPALTAFRAQQLPAAPRGPRCSPRSVGLGWALSEDAPP